MKRSLLCKLLLWTAAGAAVSALPVCAQGAPAISPERSSLYSQQELTRGMNLREGKGGWDLEVYRWFVDHGGMMADRSSERREAEHDESISYALREYAAGKAAKHRPIVGVMGNALEDERCTAEYRQTVMLGYELSHAGYVVSTGGGPGEMEAANLGAYLAPYERTSVDEAIAIFRKHALPSKDESVCRYRSKQEYIEAALEVRIRFPDGGESLGVPTWFYGHEPTNAFASVVAKFFSNAIREDLLLAYANGGMIFVEGRAGLRQEIFQKLTMNDFDTYCYDTPLVFLGKREFEQNGLYTLVQKLEENRKQPGILLTESEDEAVSFLRSHPAVRARGHEGVCRNIP